MKRNQFFVFLTAAALTLSCFAGCATPAEHDNEASLSSQEEQRSDIVSFRPVDCGV